jgi:uncharacterized protein YbaR (Trm112 family)
MTTVEDLMRSVADRADAAYALARDFRIIHVNLGFRRFALANGGEHLCKSWDGLSAIDAIAPVLRPFYVAAFENAWQTGQPWDHEYECSSPELYRRFHLVAYPVQRQFLVIVHSRTVEVAHTRSVCAPDVRAYEVDGFIKMCSHCRRVRNLSETERWDWVPAYLCNEIQNVSHGLCNPCAEFYWTDSE